ncbi:MAG: type I-E CRISPR-associated protein Cas5/CasD [Acidimicrobiales bacterium]
MATLVACLAGPLQSYGEQTRFSTRGTLPYPTYSALIGLARASLGLGRRVDVESIRWLRDLSMAIRVDQAGTLIVDYQTINPPAVSAYLWLSAADRKKIQHIVPNGTGGVWRVPSGVPPMLTERTYIAGASFTWFIEGNDDEIGRLGAALEEPYWPLSLGRKACVPDWPLRLGTTDLPMMEAATTVPSVGSPGPRSVHVLAGPEPSGGRTVTHVDDPVGSHPHDGYEYRTRHITDITPPALVTRRELLAWVEEHLR